MRRISLVLIAGITFLSVLLVHAKPAWACSCVMPLAPSGAFAQADAVFEGKVMGIADKRPLPFLDQIRNWLGLPHLSSYGLGRLVSVQVHSSWKGVTTTVADVQTGYGGGDCGYGFAMGTSYVIYAHRNPEANLETNSCLRTTETTLATADLTYLGTLPTLPLTAVPRPINYWAWFCLGALIVFATLAFTTFWHVRRRRTYLANSN